ncbi:MAG: class I poly(R)-hydroxyalkanoic acid synthase [Proteobacteria bacterium]|nr:class I poly(R)-hydroxyalkanoic acid synthase [Pseudomonadota bacterium]MBS0493758.1 class I poly(R)-hydroxyalkanoic acid synthase [Pseudomonadota bacterium]
MNTPFNMPDEYTQGLVKAGQNLMQALVAGSTAQLGDAASAGTTPLVQLQSDYLKQQFTLWARMMSGGLTGEPVVAVERGDRRFHGSEWQENPTYSLLKQGYLLNSRFLTDLVEAAEIDESTRHRLRFYMRQFVDAMSPANFAATNPDVLKLAMESGGKSLRTGLENLQADLRKGGLSITDESAFEIGKNVAVSEGSVVFENELFQLIQYAPLTDTVASRPLVIVPPCINKFYILDLQPENSFVRFCAEQGHSVFLVSWRNPDASGGHLTWDDYVERGAIAALEVAREVSGADQVNALGWCVGGTILSTALAVLAARGDTSVASLTLLTTMLDFREPGDLGVFIDEQNVLAREKTIGNGGIYPGSELGFVFQTLRANDLIWPNVINNYLKGKSPEAFDLLFWNADSTNLPGPMYAWYLRNMYLENNLAVAGKLSVCGQVLDVGRIKVPSYVLATREDHIVPWRSAYLTTQLLGGLSQFVLGASGHIAGVINPVSKNKRSYWVGGRQGDDPQAWLDSASETPGSWWSHWNTWLTPFRGDSVAAPRKPGSRKYKVIEPAPGRYVQVRAGDAK